MRLDSITKEIVFRKNEKATPLKVTLPDEPDLITPQIPRTYNSITYVAGTYIHRMKLTKGQFEDIPKTYPEELSLFAKKLGLFAPKSAITYNEENDYAEIVVSDYIKTANDEVKRFVNSLAKRISEYFGIPYTEPRVYKEQYVLDDLRIRRDPQDITD